MLDTIEIKVCTKSVRQGIWFSLAMIFAGVGVILLDASSIQLHRQIPFFIIVLCGLISLIGLYLIFTIIFRYYLNYGAGLTLSNEGVIVNTNGISTKLIPWNSIESFGGHYLAGSVFFDIFLPDPYSYIQSNFFVKFLLMGQCKAYGTPISFSSSGLQISHDDLVSKVNMYAQT